MSANDKYVICWLSKGVPNATEFIYCTELTSCFTKSITQVFSNRHGVDINLNGHQLTYCSGDGYASDRRCLREVIDLKNNKRNSWVVYKNFHWFNWSYQNGIFLSLDYSSKPIAYVECFLNGEESRGTVNNYRERNLIDQDR